MGKTPSTEDLRLFATVARKSSFIAAAAELGLSAANVTKRVHMLEANLGTRLFHRTTRRVSVTEDGERVYFWAQQILDNVDHLVDELSERRQAPRGALRICSSFGFGRNIVGPLVSSLVSRYPQLQIRFEVFDRLIDIASEGFDLDVRVGDEIAPHLIARRLASNHRVLCAAPSYVARRGSPKSVSDLATHDCLIIKERDHPFGIWRLRCGTHEQTVKVTGPLSSNNGEIVVSWAVDGRGITLRSLWDVGPLLERGDLVQLLPEFTQEANVWAVYPSRLETSAKVRVCVEWMEDALRALQPIHLRNAPTQDIGRHAAWMAAAEV